MVVPKNASCVGMAPALILSGEVQKGLKQLHRIKDQTKYTHGFQGDRTGRIAAQWAFTLGMYLCRVFEKCRSNPEKNPEIQKNPEKCRIKMQNQNAETNCRSNLWATFLKC
jgi:hypothetical protein